MHGFLNSTSGEFQLQIVHNPNKKPNAIKVDFLAFENFKVENNLIV